MPAAEQSFANHGNYRPLFHFSTLPIFLINAIVFIVIFAKNMTGMNAWMAVVMTAIFVFVFDNRISITTLQDRVIRDEMRMRLERLLGAGARERIATLTVAQLIGLRFASDAELPALVERVHTGELPTRRTIKQAVQSWQTDDLRA